MAFDRSGEPSTVRLVDRVPHPELSERDLVTLEVSDRVVRPELLAVGGELTIRLQVVAHRRENVAELARTVREYLPVYLRVLADQSEIATHYDDPINVIGG